MTMSNDVPFRFEQAWRVSLEHLCTQLRICGRRLTIAKDQLLLYQEAHEARRLWRVMSALRCQACDEGCINFPQSRLVAAINVAKKIARQIP